VNEATDTIMGRLKWETRDLHSHTESRPLQRRIAKGEVMQDEFAEYLGQLLLAHRALEAALDRARPRHPSIRALADDRRMRVPDLEQDLAYFRVDATDLTPRVSTSRFIEMVGEWERSNPVALLGPFYVLEGSTNGGRFLARVLRKAWRLDGDGLRYLDPYGDEQPQRWASFKEIMNEAGFTPGEEDSIVDAACRTFRTIAELSEEVRPAD